MENCSVINQSSDTFHMKCVPGFDGGMNQTFHILVRDRASNTIKYDNASLARPELIIGESRYPPSLHTQLLIYDLLTLILELQMNLRKDYAKFYNHRGGPYFPCDICSGVPI